MTKTSPSLSPLLCFSLLVTRALINQPFSWESWQNQISQVINQHIQCMITHTHGGPHNQMLSLHFNGHFSR